MDAKPQNSDVFNTLEHRAVWEELQRRELIAKDPSASLPNQYQWSSSAVPKFESLEIPTYWEQESEANSPSSQPPAKGLAEEDFTACSLDWLWPGHLACGKVSLLTGRSGDGKSLIIADLIARVTSGHNWPDETPQNPARVLLLSPQHGLKDMVLPRLDAAGANLSAVQIVSTVTRLETAGREYRDAFSLPLDGPLLETTLEKSENLRLLVIDSLSAFIDNSTTTSERESLLADLALLAETHNISIVCVEGMRSNGLVPLPRPHEWRADYDRHFTAVWGVARDPRNAHRRLFLPVRHHLGNDRLGYQFEIIANEQGIAGIEWGDSDETITFAEATGRVRLGRSVWSFSQTAQAESWLRLYLAEGEKSSVDILSDARKVGLTEYPVREGLRRIATKFKQGMSGGWSWRLHENGQNTRVSLEDENLRS